MEYHSELMKKVRNYLWTAVEVRMLQLGWNFLGIQVLGSFPSSFPDLSSICEIVACVQETGSISDTLWTHPHGVRILPYEDWDLKELQDICSW